MVPFGRGSSGKVKGAGYSDGADLVGVLVLGGYLRARSIWCGLVAADSVRRGRNQSETAPRDRSAT